MSMRGEMKECQGKNSDEVLHGEENSSARNSLGNANEGYGGYSLLCNRLFVDALMETERYSESLS